MNLRIRIFKYAVIMLKNYMEGIYYKSFGYHRHDYNLPNFNSLIKKSNLTDKTLFECKFGNATEITDKRTRLVLANKVCNHKFNLLGSGEKLFRDKIPWHSDFISNYQWNSSKYYKNIKWEYNINKKFGNKYGNDIKVPWELSRFQHLPILGHAYLITNDEKYTTEFVYQISNWIAENPYKLGVNWSSPMDVSIRAINWIFAYKFFENSSNLSGKFRMEFVKILYLHGKYLKDNLRIDQRYKANHYVSDLIGLIFLGLFFNRNRGVKKWLEIGIKELFKEIKNQVNPDGTHYEGSTNYHRLVTEMFVTAIIFLLQSGFTVPENCLEKVKKMIEFILYYTKPDGRAPIIGDADDGRLFKFSELDINDHRYLLNIGAVLFDCSDFKNAFPKFNEESYWLLGDVAYEKFSAMKPSDNFSLKSKAFPDNGFHIMRKDDLYMFICGGYQKKSLKIGHLHFDTLSFELYAGDKAFIIDPGTYVYTSHPEWRNKFRSTAYHNTVMVDSIDQNEFHKNGIFQMGSFNAITKLNLWKSNDEYDMFDGEHYGYHRLKKSVTHRRKIYFNKKEKYWEITDILTGKGIHKFEWYFHFSPMELEQDADNPLIVRTRCKGTNITLIPVKVPNGLCCKILYGWVSHGYGRKEMAPVVNYIIVQKVPVTFTIKIICLNYQ